MRFVINMNGQSRKAFVEQNYAMSDALRRLEAAIRDAAPHPRDYQTLADANEAWMADIEVFKQISEHMEAIKKVVDERAERILDSH